MAVSDEQIGANVSLMRKGRSQKEVADKMRDRGWKWSQATVWSVEKGERPLRLAESVDLAKILGTDVPVLFQENSTNVFHQLYLSLNLAQRRLLDQIREYEQTARMVISNSMHHELSESDETDLMNALRESPARLFAEAYSDESSKDWRLLHEQVSPAPEVAAALDRFNRRVSAMQRAWISDAQILLEDKADGIHPEAP